MHLHRIFSLPLPASRTRDDMQVQREFVVATELFLFARAPTPSHPLLTTYLGSFPLNIAGSHGTAALHVRSLELPWWQPARQSNIPSCCPVAHTAGPESNTSDDLRWAVLSLNSNLDHLDRIFSPFLTAFPIRDCHQSALPFSSIYPTLLKHPATAHVLHM